MTDDPNRLETRLHDAVQSYGSSIEPGDRLGEIRRATRAEPRTSWRRPWLLAACAAAATAAVVVGAVALTDPGDTAGQAPVAGGETRDVTVYTVGEVGARLWLYPDRVSVPSTGDPVYDALNGLLGDDPTAAEDAPGAGCGFGHLESVTVERDGVRVEIADDGSLCDRSPAAARAQQQQLAWTVQEASDTDVPVQLSVGGEPSLGQPLTADPAALSPVILEVPADGATVPSPALLAGRGNTFEGNVQWQVLDADGEVVRHGYETAGTMGDFRPFEVKVPLPAGDYTVRAFEISMEDGSLFAEDTGTFTVE